MFFGFLIGLTIWGFLAAYYNASTATKYTPDRRTTGQRVVFMVGNACFIIGLFASIGWCLESYHLIP